MTHRKDVLLFNPYHDRLGRFATKVSGTAVGVARAFGKHAGSRTAENIAKGAGRSLVFGGVTIGVTQLLGKQSPTGHQISGLIKMFAGTADIVVGTTKALQAHRKKNLYVIKGGDNAAELWVHQQEIDKAEVKAGSGFGLLTLGAVESFMAFTALQKLGDAPGAGGYTARSRQSADWTSKEEARWKEAMKASHPDVRRSQYPGFSESENMKADEAVKVMNSARDIGDAKTFNKTVADLRKMGFKNLSEADLAEITEQDVRENMAIAIKIFEDFLASGKNTLVYPGWHDDKPVDIDRASVKAFLEVIRIMIG